MNARASLLDRALELHQQLTAWPEPDPLPELPPVQAFSESILPESHKDFVMDIAERMQCPPDFPAMASVVMAGAALGNKIGIRPKMEDNWTVVPNVWGMVIGQSGIMKSPALSDALAPMRSLQREAMARHEEKMLEHEIAAQAEELRVADRKARAKQELQKSGNAHDISQYLRHEKVEPPVLRRYIVNDTTVEALAETLKENPHGVLIDRDELIGWLKALDREGQQEARAFYLTAADGDKGFATDRITRGRGHYIDAVCVSIIGGIQPGVLAGYVRQTQTGGSGDDGLLQRFGLMVYPDVSPEWKNIDRKPDIRARDHMDLVIRHLSNISPEEVGAETDPLKPIPFLRFDPEAQGLFNEWRTGLELRLRSPEDHPAIISHLSKYRKTLPALALIYHLSEGVKGPVTCDSLIPAMACIEYLESHARRVYSYASRPEVNAAKTIIAKVRHKKLPAEFKASQIYRQGWSGLSTSEEAWAAIRLLTDHGYIREHREDNTGGRPSSVFEAHPSIIRAL